MLKRSMRCSLWERVGSMTFSWFLGVFGVSGLRLSIEARGWSSRITESGVGWPVYHAEHTVVGRSELLKRTSFCWSYE